MTSIFRHPRDMAPLLKFFAMLGFIGATYLTGNLLLILAIIAIEGLLAFSCGVFRAFRITTAALLIGAFTLCLFQIFLIPDGKIVVYLISKPSI